MHLKPVSVCVCAAFPGPPKNGALLSATSIRGLIEV